VSVNVSGSEFVVELWDVTTGERLASTSFMADSYPTDISFDDDGVGIILRYRDDKTLRWRLSPVHAHSDESSSDALSLPMVFLPAQVADPSTPLDKSPQCQYRYEWGSPWIFDRQNRQMLWIPPANRRRIEDNSHENKFVLCSTTGIVTIVDFRI